MSWGTECMLPDMGTQMGAVDTLLITPNPHETRTHYELLEIGREEFHGTVTVVGLAS